MDLYAGQILFIDVSKKTWWTEPLKQEIADTYIGGRGFGIRYLYDLIPPKADPLGPKNCLFVGTGPFSGTTLPSNARTIFMAKSPLGQIGWSNAGGHFGAELKFTGYDAVIIMGQSKEPIYIVIKHNQVDFFPAKHLEGMTIKEGYEAIREEQQVYDLEAFLIGPAGEKKVTYASIISAGRLRGKTAGRTGMGAVMGSKNVKAICTWGDQDVTIKNPQAFEEAIQEFYDQCAADPATKQSRLYGSSNLVTAIGNNGALVTRNFQTGVFEDQEAINEKVLRKKYVVKNEGCFACIHLCTAMVKIDEGPYAGLRGKKPEFETLAMLGSNVGIGRMDAILKYNDQIDELGMDCISLGATISFAQELWQRGILTEEDTDGMNLDWGNYKVIEQLIEDIAYRRTKLGDILANGVREAAKIINRGSEKYAIHTKGLEIIGGDPRGQFGFALGYSTCTRGGDHLGALPKAEYFNQPELGLKMFGAEESTTRFGVKGKGRLVKWYENFKTIIDAFNVCSSAYAAPSSFEFTINTPAILGHAYLAATGVDLSVEDFLERGERILTLERLFNLREGYTVKDDTLPKRFLEEPFKDGASKGKVVPLKEMLDEYYEARDWDKVNGFPSQKVLTKLSLKKEAGLAKEVLNIA